jgi:hypothetical protein
MWLLDANMDVHLVSVLNGREAVFDLNCRTGPIELRESYGFPRREIGRILRGLADRLGELCRAWERIHGVA